MKISESLYQKIAGKFAQRHMQKEIYKLTKNRLLFVDKHRQPKRTLECFLCGAQTDPFICYLGTIRETGTKWTGKTIVFLCDKCTNGK